MAIDNKTDKSIDVNDASQVLGYAFNPVDNSLTTAPFLVGVVGRKVQRVDTAPGDLGGSAAGDDFSYYEGTDLLYTIRVLYNDVGKTDFHSAQRVA